MPLYRCGALLLAAGAVASVAASADSEVFINNISYPICPESGIVTVKCAAKTTYASAELYELHEVDSIVCSSFILLPAENVWSAGLRTMLYFFALLYCFLGIAIIADVFMGAIEKITSSTVKRKLANGTEVTYRVWNETVANLTLMALGSSAPEILLSCLETVGGLGREPEAGLGPSCIVGSAAFNLLGISAVCVVSVEEPKSIKNFGVFAVTASASLFAYVWLSIVLNDDQVELYEAWLSFLMFPAIVVVAYVIDSRNKPANRTVTDMSLTGDTGATLVSTKDQVKAMAKKLNNETGGASDAEIAKRIAIENHGGQSKNMYRINAVRGMAGRRPVMPKLIRGLGDKIGQIDFAQDVYKVPENIHENGGFNVTLIKTGGDSEVVVKVETVEGSAKAGVKFKRIKEEFKTITFGACQSGETVEHDVPIEIINTSDIKEDVLDFSVRIVGVRGHAVEGEHTKAVVKIVDCQDKGQLSFAQNVYNVADYKGKADITVCRENGSNGPLNCKVVIEDGTAKQGQHFEKPKEDDLNLEFKSGETKKIVSIPLKDHDDLSALNKKFTMSLSGDAVDAEHSSAQVYIVDGNINETVSQVARLMENNAALFGVSSSSWGQQFHSAMALAGEDEEVSTMDCVMHFLTFGWKVLFATVPPTEYGNGWLAFAVALTYIGGLTAIVGEVATIFGCSMGLPKAITAITFVALGTSLPDTFASKAAAQGEDSADAAVGNVTGSNAVNVFLGLGVPWVIGSCYCQALPSDPACSSDGAGNYMMLAGALNFSVLVFTVCSVICLCTLVVRRVTCGGEIGGPAPARWATFGLFIGLWVVYIIMSSLCSLPGMLHSLVPACTP